jgi:hypothetical protein
VFRWLPNLELEETSNAYIRYPLADVGNLLCEDWRWRELISELREIACFDVSFAYPSHSVTDLLVEILPFCMYLSYDQCVHILSGLLRFLPSAITL